MQKAATQVNIITIITTLPRDLFTWPRSIDPFELDKINIADIHMHITYISPLIMTFKHVKLVHICVCMIINI